MHVSRIDYELFYRPAFQDSDAARQFVARVEAVPSPAKIILHQAARMLWLADRMDEIAKGRPSLQILFFLIAAEAIAKLVFEFKGEGESRRHVHLFFEEVCADEHRAALSRAFESGHWLSCEQAVDLLYDVRCSVAHEGRYFDLLLPTSSDPTPLIQGRDWEGEQVVAHITASRLRQVVFEGAVMACRRVLP